MAVNICVYVWFRQAFFIYKDENKFINEGEPRLLALLTLIDCLLLNVNQEDSSLMSQSNFQLVYLLLFNLFFPLISELKP